MRTDRTTLLTYLVLAFVAALAVPAAAAAHVRVTPEEAAAGDYVRFEFTVPNEDDKPTTEVEIRIPPGVEPASFEDTPGWEREVERDGDTVSLIRWTGSLEPETFVRFSFIAATPSEPGPVTFKSLQTYAGNEVVRWIGDPDSDHPAPFTDITEAAEQTGTSHSGTATETTSVPAGAEPAADPGRDGLTLALAIAALVVGVAAVGLSLRRRA